MALKRTQTQVARGRRDSTQPIGGKNVIAEEFGRVSESRSGASTDYRRAVFYLPARRPGGFFSPQPVDLPHLFACHNQISE